MDHYWVGLYALLITGGNYPKSIYSLEKGHNLPLFGTCVKSDSVLLCSITVERRWWDFFTTCHFFLALIMVLP